METLAYDKHAMDARSDTSSTSTLTAASMNVSGSSAASSKPSSSVLDNFEQDANYKPVTNFEPQERVNPFDKGKSPAVPLTTTSGGSTTSSTSSSSISSSSISSRINRNSNNIKSPPPPTGPPPAPPAAAATVNPIMTSSYKSTTSYSTSEVTKESKLSSYNYGSSSSIESTTRMETTTTTTATVGEAAAAAGAIGPSATNINTNTTTNNDWKPNMGLRSASVYSAPAATTTAAMLPGDTSGYVSNSSPASNGYNSQQPEVPSYTRPSYSRSESNASKKSDLDIIFGDSKDLPGNGKYTRSSGSLTDAELIFGGPSSYKTDRFGSSKSMSVTSDRSSGVTGTTSYKIYEGIQNAGFADYNDSPTKPMSIGSTSSIKSYSSANRWSKPQEEDDELDLK